jgi:hypothetical protein
MNLEIITIPPKPVPPPTKTFNLSLTQDEANKLRVIVGSLGSTGMKNLLIEAYDVVTDEAVRSVLDFSEELFTALMSRTTFPDGVGKNPPKINE